LRVDRLGVDDEVGGPHAPHERSNGRDDTHPVFRSPNMERVPCLEAELRQIFQDHESESVQRILS
jgi:hypothetical protein